jgi:hypothetical protein
MLTLNRIGLASAVGAVGLGYALSLAALPSRPPRT